MLKKQYRLTQLRLDRPKTLSEELFTIKYSRNNTGVSRFAFVVSKKIDQRATGRNALKRKVRSCAEELFDNIDSGYDFIFYPKTKAIDAPREKILSDVKNVFSKEGFLK